MAGGPSACLAAGNGIPHVAEEVRAQDATEVPDKEPIGNRHKVEDLWDGVVYVAADGAVDQPVPQHGKESAKGGQQGNAQRVEGSSA